MRRDGPQIRYLLRDRIQLKQRELFDPEWMCDDPVENLGQHSVKNSNEEEYYQSKLNFGEAVQKSETAFDDSAN